MTEYRPVPDPVSLPACSPCLVVRRVTGRGEKVLAVQAAFLADDLVSVGRVVRWPSPAPVPVTVRGVVLDAYPFPKIGSDGVQVMAKWAVLLSEFDAGGNDPREAADRYFPSEPNNRKAVLAAPVFVAMLHERYDLFASQHDDIAERTGRFPCRHADCNVSRLLYSAARGYAYRMMEQYRRGNLDATPPFDPRDVFWKMVEHDKIDLSFLGTGADQAAVVRLTLAALNEAIGMGRFTGDEVLLEPASPSAADAAREVQG